MTRMIPTTVHSSTRSGAERRLFELIRDATGTSDWVCIHSLGLAQHVRKRRGEIDFAIVTPEAVLILEVKGGRVERRSGVWVFTDRYGVPHTSDEGPFDQASSAMFSLERELRQHFGERSRLANVLLGFGVMFPDVEFDAHGVEAHPAQVYDRRCASKPVGQWLRALIQYTRSRQGSPRNGLDGREMKELVDYLQGDFELVPSFDTAAEDVNQGLARLTRQQAASLASFDECPRLLVQGAAGTGKSLIAVETARREAVRGRSTLLLCFNKLLAERLRHATVAGVDTFHAHAFMKRSILRSPLSADFQDMLAKEPPPKHLYSELYPQFAALALDDASSRYDRVLVDEAQDLLSPAFLPVLDRVVEGGLAEGAWRLFMDVNEQAAIYGNLEDGVLQKLREVAPTAMLSLNCRNTMQIELATRAIAQPRSTALASHSGEDVERRWYKDEKGLLMALRSVQAELRERQVPAGCVTYLYGATSQPVVKALQDAGARLLTVDSIADVGRRDCSFSTHTTVSSFKGLENDVIVFVGIDRVDDGWWRAVTYVGMSRARVKLYILLNSTLHAEVDRRSADVVREQLEEEGSHEERF